MERQAGCWSTLNRPLRGTYGRSRRSNMVTHARCISCNVKSCSIWVRPRSMRQESRKDQFLLKRPTFSNGFENWRTSGTSYGRFARRNTESPTNMGGNPTMIVWSRTIFTTRILTPPGRWKQCTVSRTELMHDTLTFTNTASRTSTCSMERRARRCSSSLRCKRQIVER